jgi:hypothetical protein
MLSSIPFIRSTLLQNLIKKFLSLHFLVEAKSLETSSEKKSLFKSHPHFNDERFRKIHYAVWERKQIEAKISNIDTLLSKNINMIREYKNQSEVLFQQPPNYY